MRIFTPPAAPIALTERQERWLASLPDARRRRWDRLPASEYPRWETARAFLLSIAEAGADEDPIIAAEIARVLGPAE
jgi:hypothetical protein